MDFTKGQCYYLKASQVAISTPVFQEVYRIEYLRATNYLKQNLPDRAKQVADSMTIKCSDSTLENYYYVPLIQAIYYNDIDEHKQAFSLLIKAEKLFLKVGEKTDNDYLTILENRGEAYHGYGDRHSKLEITKRVARLRAKKKDWYMYMYNTYQIAHGFEELKEIDSAIFYYLKTQDIAKEHKVGENFIGMFKGLPFLYVRKGELEKAKAEVIKLENAIEKNTTNDAATINNRSSGYSNIGYYYAARENSEVAIKYFTKAINELKQLGTKPQGLSGLYGAKGRNLTAMGDYEKAIEVLKRQLYIFCFDEVTDSNTWPTHEQMIPKLYSVSAYFNVAETYYQKSKNGEGYDIKALRKCVYLLNQGLTLNEKALALVTNLKTRLFYLTKLDRYLNYYLIAIDDLKLAGENVDKDIREALALFNRYKEGILRTKLQIESLEGDGSLPYRQLISMQNEFNSLYFKSDKTENELATIDSLQNKITSISTELVEDNPNAFNLIYGAKNLDLAKIQSSLGTNDVIYFYQVVYNNIYRFDIYRDSIDFFLSYKVDELNALTTELCKHMATNNVGGYCNLAYNLFNELDIDTQFTNIYIVSSNLAATVPFDALLYKQAEDTTSFKNLPYLFLNNNISMLSHLDDFRSTKSSTRSNRNYVAFAPSFSNSSSEFLAVRDADRSLLVDLPGAIDEIMSSAKLFSNSNLFLRENATEASFKSNASNAGILHFATHAFVDLENPLNSHLVLSEKDTINEDGILYAHELMGLNLNAELAILSACNTGVGKPENIEGAQNLAYAFAFSGVKNVLVTLWNTADASAPIIVKRFLENTSNGEPIGAALSNAKKDYINQADDIMANPFYWANFSLQGNPNDVIVEENKAPIFLIIGGAVFLLFGLGFVILKARK